MNQIKGGKLRVVSLPSLQLVAERSSMPFWGNCVSKLLLGSSATGKIHLAKS